MASRESINAVTMVTGCDEETAEALLARHNNNAEQATNAYFDDPGAAWTTTATPPHPPLAHGATSFPHMPNGGHYDSWSNLQPLGPENNPPPPQRPSSPANHGRRITQGDRNNPVDLTGADNGNEDEELQRAMAASLEDAAAHAAGRGGTGSSTRQAGVSGPSTPFAPHYDDEGVAADEDMDLGLYEDEEEEEDENAAPYSPRRNPKRKSSRQSASYGTKMASKKPARCSLGASTSGNWQNRQRGSTSSSNEDDYEDQCAKKGRGRNRNRAGPSYARPDYSRAGSTPPPSGVRRSTRQRTAAPSKDALPSAMISATNFTKSFPPKPQRMPSPPPPYKDDMLTRQKCNSQRKVLDVFANATSTSAAANGSGGGGAGSASTSRQSRATSTRPARATTGPRRRSEPNAAHSSNAPIVIDDDDEDGPSAPRPPTSSSSSSRLPRSLFDLMSLQRQHAKSSGRKLERYTQAKKVASANAELSDEEAMEQAIKASIGFDQQHAFQAPQHFQLPLQRRQDGHPLALVSHIPVLSPLATLLSALLSCPSARRAFLSFRPPDDRLLLQSEGSSSSNSGLAGYHSGRSPGDLPYRTQQQYHSLDPSVRSAFETVWRAQVLAAFAGATQHAACVVGDVLVDVPQETLSKASRGSEGGVASSYYQHLAKSWYNAGRYVNDVEWQAGGDGQVDAGPAWEVMKRTFHSVGTAQPPSPGATSPLDDQNAVDLPLEVDAGAPTTVTAALTASLASKQASITQPSKVLAFSVTHPPLSRRAEGSGLVVEPTIYLDRFMWQRRCQLDLTAQKAREEELNLRQATIDSLKKRRTSLTTHDGTGLFTLLRNSIDYLQHKADMPTSLALILKTNTNGSATDGDGDPFIDTHRNDAVTSLREILAALEEEVKQLDEEISSMGKELGEKRREVQRELDKVFESDEWKTMPYRLRGVLAAKGSAVGAATSTSVAYFRGRGGVWWKDEGLGEVVPVEESEALCQASASTAKDTSSTTTTAAAPTTATPYYLFYNDATEDDDPTAEEEALLFPSTLREAIEQDNDLLESTLLSLAPADTSGAGEVSAGAGGGAGAGGIDGDGDATMVAGKGEVSDAAKATIAGTTSGEESTTVTPALEVGQQEEEKTS